MKSTLSQVIRYNGQHKLITVLEHNLLFAIVAGSEREKKIPFKIKKLLHLYKTSNWDPSQVYKSKIIRHLPLADVVLQKLTTYKFVNIVENN